MKKLPGNFLVIVGILALALAGYLIFAHRGGDGILSLPKKTDSEPAVSNGGSSQGDEGQPQAIPGNSRPKSLNPLANKLIEMLTPPSATSADWKNAKVVKSCLDNAPIPFWVLTNMRPILDADTNTTAFHVRATNRRDSQGKIQTTVWSNKNGNTLEIDWSSGIVNRRDRRTDEGPKFDETNPEQNGRETSNLGFTASPKLVISFWNEGREICYSIPFEHFPYHPVGGYISNSYPMAAMPLIPKAMTSPSILVIDIFQKKILGKIELPKEAKGGRPNFILDMENDVLLSSQFGLDWLMAIDFRPYKTREKTEPK